MKGKNSLGWLMGGVAILATIVSLAQGAEMVLRDRLNLGPFVFVGAAVVLIGVVVWRWGYLHLVRTGIINFSSEFTEDEKAWDQAKKSLVYVGVTGFSITERFLAWCEKNQEKLPAKIRFYLIGPDDAESLQLIASHRAGREATPAEVERLANEVKAALGKLQTCPAVEVKFYKITSDFIPVWMYIIDGEKIYLGFPAPGETGMNSPAYLCHRRAGKYGLFNAYSDLLGRLGKEEKK